MEVQCRQCIGCRMAKANEWAVRCLHESRMTERTAFVTLTYDNEHLPYGGTVLKSHHQKFIRALRDRLRKRGDEEDIRYYMCGEYGADEYVTIDGKKQYRIGPGRPHYHYIIFGYEFPDREPHTEHRGHTYYRSKELEQIWTKGHSIIGNVTVETAAYTARYVMKKQTGEQARDHYTRTIIETGEILEIEPEFSLMSLKPGIGATWFKKYGETEIHDASDFIVINGKKYKTPKYYDKLYEDLDERELVSMKDRKSVV